MRGAALICMVGLMICVAVNGLHRSERSGPSSSLRKRAATVFSEMMRRDDCLAEGKACFETFKAAAKGLNPTADDKAEACAAATTFLSCVDQANIPKDCEIPKDVSTAMSELQSEVSNNCK